MSKSPENCTETGSPLGTISPPPNLKYGPDGPTPRMAIPPGKCRLSNFFKFHRNVITVNTKYSPSGPSQPKRPPRHGHPLQYPVPYCKTNYLRSSPPPSPRTIKSPTGTVCLLRLPWSKPWHPSSPGCFHLTNHNLEALLVPPPPSNIEAGY